MKLTNDNYLILMGTKNFTERYFRDKKGWLKITARGREFRMTAEQVLNHLLPAVAGAKSNIFVRVEHRDMKKSQGSQNPGFAQLKREDRAPQRSLKWPSANAANHNRTT